MPQTFKTHPISKEMNSTNYTIYPEHCYKITLDQYTREMFVQLMVTTAGSLVVESKSGAIKYYPVVNPGFLIPASGVRVLTSATLDGDVVNTTATGIYGYGGM